MVNFSWYQWLRNSATSGTRNKARKPVTAGILQIEGLESRTLLTANLPVAVADPGYVVNEDGLLIGTSVLTNDTDADGDTIDQAILQSTTAHGNLTLNLDGTFLYLPHPNFNGTDSFTYFARDSVHGETSATPATVTITITAVPDAPIANAAQVSTAEDTLLNGTLTGSDADGDSLAYSAGSTAAAHGVVVINPNGTFTYTPAANYFGGDSFSFKVNDGTFNSADATVTVTVTSVNDVPVANPLSISMNEDTPFNGSLTGSDVEGSPLTYSQGSVLAAHGSVTINPNGSFNYTPTANYSGPDSFTFKVNDGTANSAEATVTVTVSSLNDVPVAVPLTLSTNEDIVLNGNLVGTDAESSPLTYSAGSIAAAHGVVVINAGTGAFTYTPTSNYNGPDSFSYKVNDGTANSLDALVSITVVAVNDLPVANPTSATTTEEVAVGGVLSATDGDGNPLTYFIGSVSPAHGTVTVTTNGFFIYTPDVNYTGSDSFTFKANDGTSNSADATVTITVTPVNDAPVAVPASISVTKNTTFNGTLVATDPDGDSLTYSAGSVAAAHGTVVIAANGTYTYTPAANYTGGDSFSFKANDGTVNSGEATVTVTVSAPNNAPTVANGVASVNEDAVLNGSVSSLGTDIDGNPLTYSVVTLPSHGTLVLSPDGTFVYTPTANFNGADSFTFRANDGQAFSNTGTVSLTVVPSDLPLTLTLPSANPQVSRNSQKVQLDPAATLIDPDTLINYNGAKITVAIANLNSADAANGRVTVTVRNQGSGSGLVKVKGSKVYYNGSSSSIATLSGGTYGKPLVITFNANASAVAVNAVLRQITIQASKKATTGNLTLNFQAVAGGQTALGTKIASIV